jgi:hypothetical protein
MSARSPCSAAIRAISSGYDPLPQKHVVPEAIMSAARRRAASSRAARAACSDGGAGPDAGAGGAWLKAFTKPGIKRSADRSTMGTPAYSLAARALGSRSMMRPLRTINV